MATRRATGSAPPELALGTDPADADTEEDGAGDGLEQLPDTIPSPRIPTDGVPNATDNTFCLGRTPDGGPDWKLFQRGATGTADIAVLVRYRLGGVCRLEVAPIAQANGASPGAVSGYHRRTLRVLRLQGSWGQRQTSDT
jgi:hypothetical protein